MKLVRHGPVGCEKPGIIDEYGNIRDLAAHLNDLTADWLHPDKLAQIKALNTEHLPVVPSNTRLGTPVAGTRQFIAIGLNYFDHAVETGQPVPAEPIVFSKAVSCIQGPNDNVRKPRGSTKMDWEVELAVVIGQRTLYASKEEAALHIAGYAVCHDLSERNFQLERLGSWDKGKGCDTFGPVGPWLVTADEVGDPQNLDMWLNVNGERRQTGNTRMMIFDCADIVSYVSQFMVLLPGDIITTGTPPGVGMGMKIPEFLMEGDVIELGIEKLGAQRHSVFPWDHTG